MKLIWKIMIGIGVVILLLVGGFTLWAYTPSAPMPEALAAMQSNSSVQVTRDGWVTFAPVIGEPDTGVIFYPGGRVDYRAYAPLMSELAAQGYLVALVPMPFNLAVFGSERASQVIAAHPEIQHWIIGGHSLGGAMAASFVYNNPEAVDGLFFLAAYPASNQSLADSGVKVLSISGTKDGLATPAKIDASIPLLPPDTIFSPIEAGNHAQFGWYGPQSGDNPAGISRESQQKQVFEKLVMFIESLRK
jgi:pimeloyl-ACP methyl ester carboxylesterase